MVTEVCKPMRSVAVAASAIDQHGVVSEFAAVDAVESRRFRRARLRGHFAGPAADAGDYIHGWRLYAAFRTMLHARRGGPQRL